MAEGSVYTTARKQFGPAREPSTVLNESQRLPGSDEKLGVVPKGMRPWELFSHCLALTNTPLHIHTHKTNKDTQNYQPSH